jgi:hypothetical protein
MAFVAGSTWYTMTTSSKAFCIHYYTTIRIQYYAESKKMSSEKTAYGNLRLEKDVVDTINILKHALELPNQSEVIREALKRAFPNIDELIQISETKEKEKAEAIKRALNKS